MKMEQKVQLFIASSVTQRYNAERLIGDEQNYFAVFGAMRYFDIDASDNVSYMIALKKELRRQLRKSRKGSGSSELENMLISACFASLNNAGWRRDSGVMQRVAVFASTPESERLSGGKHCREKSLSVVQREICSCLCCLSRMACGELQKIR